MSSADSSGFGPLRRPVFRSLWIGALAANVGLWIQNTVGSWDMTSLASAPVFVALLQTASSLPVLLVGLPAAAFGDIFDRRRLLAGFAGWMAAVSAVLAGLSLMHALTAELLLALTFALGLGAALSAPLWQAVLPSLVEREELPAAVTLGGVAVNLARALGPALGGVGIAAVGSGPVYAFNAAAFTVVVVQVLRWRQEERRSTLPPERVIGAVIAGLRFARRAPALRAVLVRAAGFIVFASGLWALLPTVARGELKMTALQFGVLLGCVGAGALAGATMMPRLRARVGPDGLVAAASVVYAATMAALGWLRIEAGLWVVMAATGVAWISIMSSLNVAAASAAPGWVQSRALGLYLLVFQGGMAVGSVIWGGLAGRFGSPMTLMIAAGGLVIAALAGLRWRLADARREDMVAWEAWPEPVMQGALEDEAGPVLVIVRYVVAGDVDSFLAAARGLEGLRRRDGAFEWGLYRDVADQGQVVETFMVASWAEHVRQHHRSVAADQGVLGRVRELGGDGGVVHLVGVPRGGGS